MAVSVMKFGGSSVADIKAMRRSANIVKNTPLPVLVIVSALASVTRKLISLTYEDTTATEQQRAIEEIRSQHYAIVASLKNDQVKKPLDSLLFGLQTLMQDYAKDREASILDELLAQGELMSSLLFTEVLREEGIKTELFDVRKVMRTTECFGKGEPILNEIKSLCAAELKPLLVNQVVVTQGFIGSDAEGRTTVLGKESSDYTAALLAEALGSEHFKIWTDVPGVFSTDPKLYPQALPIAELSFGEALELTTFGAKVLHSRTLEPAIRQNMRCFVGSSVNPESGTWIGMTTHSAAKVHAITFKKEQMLIRLERSYKTSNLHFLESFVEILNRYQIDFDLLTNHGLSTTLVLDDSLANWHHKSLLSEALIQELKLLGKIEITKGVTLLALVGQHIPQCPSIKKILSATLEDMDISAFYYGTSPYSLCVVTPMAPGQLEASIARLHQQLIG